MDKPAPENHVITKSHLTHSSWSLKQILLNSCSMSADKEKFQQNSDFSISTCTVLVITHVIENYILEVRKIIRLIFWNYQLSNFFLAKGLINNEQFNVVVFEFAKKQESIWKVVFAQNIMLVLNCSPASPAFPYCRLCF